MRNLIPNILFLLGLMCTVSLPAQSGISLQGYIYQGQGVLGVPKETPRVDQENPDVAGEIAINGNRERTMGLLADFPLSRRLSLRSGLTWTRDFAYELFLLNPGMADPEWGVPTEVDPTCPLVLIFQRDFLELPVAFKYTFLQRGRFQLYAAPTITASVKLRQITRVVLTGEQVSFGAAWGEFTYGAKVTMGAVYRIADRLFVALEPTLNMRRLRWMSNRMAVGAGLSVGYNLGKVTR